MEKCRYVGFNSLDACWLMIDAGIPRENIRIWQIGKLIEYLPDKQKPVDFAELLSCDEIIITCGYTSDACFGCLVDMLVFLKHIVVLFSDTRTKFSLIFYKNWKKEFKRYTFTIDDLHDIPELKSEELIRNTIFVPDVCDKLPTYTDFASWIKLIYQRVATELTRYFVYPNIKTGLTLYQKMMLKHKSSILGLDSVGSLKYPRITRICAFYYAQLKIYRDLFTDANNPNGKRFGRPCGNRRNCPWWNKTKRECFPFINDKAFYFSVQEFDYDSARAFFNCFFPFKNFPLNKFGKDLIGWEQGRPIIMPRSKWESEMWHLAMTERHPLFPLLLWHGHHGKALDLECYFPPHNFHDVINALRCSIEKKRIPLLRMESDIFDESKQILWDGKCLKAFSTVELVEYYAKQLVGDFGGNVECALFYLNALQKKYAGIV